jgi:hypothetical protein
MTLRTRTQPRYLSLPRLPLVLGVVLALVCSYWALQRGATYVLLGLNYPAPLDGQEGFALWEAALLRSGQPLYQPVVPDNFISAPYPPVHPLLLALIGQSDVPHVFWSGRLVSLLAALGVAIAGFGVVWRVTSSRLAGVAAAVLLLAFAPLQLWALRIKPDMVGLLFTVAGLWLVSRCQVSGVRCQVSESDPHQYPDSKSETRNTKHGPRSQISITRHPSPVTRYLSPSFIAAALAFVLAHFSKQTMLAGPLAAGTYLLLLDWKLALRWGALYLALLGAAWIALDLVTYGQYTYHIWVLHKLDWTGSRFWKLATQLRDTWPLLILGVMGVVACIRRPTVINAYLLWAPASLIGAGVEGSHHNHLLETGAALALAGGQAIGLGLMWGGSLRVLAPVLLATQLLLWRTPLPWFAGDYDPDPNYDRYIEFVRATPGAVMADDVGLVYAAGKPLRYDDPAAMGPAADRDLWDQRQFVADIRAGRFSALLLPMDVWEDGLIDPSGRWTPEMLQAVKDRYEIKFKDTLMIYVPRATP